MAAAPFQLIASHMLTLGKCARSRAELGLILLYDVMSGLRQGAGAKRFSKSSALLGFEP